MTTKGSHAAAGSFARDVTKRAAVTLVLALVVAGIAVGVTQLVSSSPNHKAASTSTVSSLPSASVPPSSATTAPAVTTTTSTVPATTTTTLAPPTPSSVSVQVLNGTSTVGAAGFFTDKLQNAGYDTLSALDASATTVTSTLVIVTPTGTMAGGEAVAHLLGLPVTVVTASAPSSAPIPSSDLSGTDVVVLIGADISAQATGQSATSAASSTTSS
jgi:hypothetical protein